MEGSKPLPYPATSSPATLSSRRTNPTGIVSQGGDLRMGETLKPVVSTPFKSELMAPVVLVHDNYGFCQCCPLWQILLFLVVFLEVWCPHFEPHKSNLLSSGPFYFQMDSFTALFTITIIRNTVSLLCFSKEIPIRSFKQCIE